jgi:hypothetical protein
VDLPTPSIIRGWWNFGSLLGICLVAQNITGLFLAIHYCPNIDTASKQSKTYLPRRKLRLTTHFKCKRCITILRLHLPTYWTKLLLRIIQLYTHTIRGSSNSILNYSNSFYRICPTMRTNVILGCNSNYKPPISNPIRRKGNCSMILRRIRGSQWHTRTTLCTELPSTICNRSNSTNPLIISSPNRINL